MWTKLSKVMGTPVNQDTVPASIAKREARRQQLINERIQSLREQAQSLQEDSITDSYDLGPSTLIGYLKGFDCEYEDSSKHIRRFINLNRLLRGKYDGKIQTDNEYNEPEINLGGENSE